MLYRKQKGKANMSPSDASDKKGNASNAMPQLTAGAFSSTVITVLTLSDFENKALLIAIVPFAVAGLVSLLSYAFAWFRAPTTAELWVNGSIDRQISKAKSIMNDEEMPEEARKTAQERLNALVKQRLTTPDLKIETD